MAEKKFNELTRDEQARRVGAFMAQGGSYRKAAEKFGSTVGAIAGLCRDYNIPSTHPPAFTGRPKKNRTVEKKAKPKAQAQPKPKKEEPTLALPPRVEPKLLPPPAPLPEPPGKPKPPYKLAVSRFTSCDDKWEDGRLCDYEREEGSRLCKLHNWMRKHPRS